MRSPFTGGEAIEQLTTEAYTIRGQEISVTAPCYECVDTGEQFTTNDQDDTFMREAERVYRERNRLPTAAILKARREELRLSAREAARFLGFGINQFSQYEAGELPSESNMLLLQLFCDPQALQSLVEARMTNLPERTMRKLQQGPVVRRGAMVTAGLAPHVWAGPTHLAAMLTPHERQLVGIYGVARQPKRAGTTADYQVKAF